MLTQLTHAIRRTALAIALVFSAAAGAQEYPSMQTRIICPYPAGSSTDVVARLVGEIVRSKWNQVVIVENRVGAGGNVGAEAVSKAAPDGYTFLVTAPGPLVINKTLYGKLAYDPDAFVPVALLVSTPNVLMVHPKVGVERVQQLIAMAKAKPGQLNYASSGSGTTGHLAAELFKSMAGVNIVHVPYKGGPPAMADLLAGQVELMFLDLSSVIPHIRADRIKALAVGSEKRNPVLPGVPAMAEVLPGFSSTTWFGMVAPAKTPAGIANMVSAAVAEGLKQPDVAKRLAGLHLEPIGGGPAEMRDFMKVETERLGKVIRDAGATAN